MCGRYTLTSPEEVIRELFGELPLPPLVPRFNIAPTQTVPAVRRLDPRSPLEVTLLRWGLVPHWAKDPALGNRMINARAETAWEKPSFREPIRRRRCLLPANGFYEWSKTDRGKQPWLIRMKGGLGFAMAGLWERWHEPATGKRLETCTILTTEPNELLARLHNRMPVILPPGAFEVWLDPDVRDRTALEPLLAPYPASQMEAYPVSRWVNDPGHDDPRCVRPLSQ